MTGKSLRESALFPIMGEHIGAYNKFVFMNGHGEIAFANDDSGARHGGMWYSNHSYRPKVAHKDMSGPFTPSADWWDDYRYCEYCGKDLDTQEEREEGLCFSCAAFNDDDLGYDDKCGGCDCVLADAVHRAVGWCDECGRYVYGDKWDAELNQCEAELEKAHDEQAY